MDYSIFDTNAILLGLLSAMLAAECIILFVKNQTFRRKVADEFDAFLKDEKVSADARKQELELSLKERAMRLETEYETLITEARKRKSILDEKLSRASFDIEDARINAQRAKEEFTKYEKLSKKSEALADEYLEKLKKAPSLNLQAIEDEAKREFQRKYETEIDTYFADLLRRYRSNIDVEARRVLLDTLGRCAVGVNTETTACVVKITNEAMKGRLIGKEGRNIRSFEACTGTTLVIDETPDSVMISSFDPARREIAKIALINLLADGRISPATIEDSVKSARSEIEKRCIDYGRIASEQLNIKNLSAEVLSKLGSLRFHLSLNQNTLEHSIETARIAAILASEIGCDSSIAKRAGLLHDIGKCVDSEQPHALAGADFLRRNGEHEFIARAVEVHHDTSLNVDLYGAILKIADSISSTRAGARMEPAESYFTRVKKLEEIARTFDGVISAYAIQSGRELRVIVEPDQVDDAHAAILAYKIKEEIANSIDSSVSVRITLIREKRFIESTRSVAP